MDPLTAISTRHTPQSQLADHRQVKNNAGGYAFQTPSDTLIHRFLTIGTSGGTYYTTERKLTIDAAKVILDAARSDATRLVEQVVTVSTAGRAPRQNPALFALAAAASLGDGQGRKTALDALPLVVRTGTHMFLFAGYVEQFRGWGRSLRRAVGAWYLDKPIEDVAYQVVKYRQREGWSHRDLLRLAHPKTQEIGRRALFQWVTKGGTVDDVPPLVSAFVEAQTATDANTWVRLVTEYPLSWEMLPDAALGHPAVWDALIEKGMPQTALVRQLSRLTRLGVLTQSSPSTRLVAAQLQDADRLRKARVHPVNILVALRTYTAGHGARGLETWTPVRQVVDALDAAFYAAFQTVEPAGKRTLLALDVSGSMTSPAGGLPISCREASAALAMVTMTTEPDTTVVGFTSRGGGWYGRDTALTELSISPRQRIDDAINAISGLPFGATDCSLPFTWAAERNLEFDTVVVYTDNETWAGNIHPHQALRQYREKTGINTRSVVVGMTTNDFTIADPNDPGSLDVAGFDSAVPNLIADFSHGDI